MPARDARALGETLYGGLGAAPKLAWYPQGARLETTVGGTSHAGVGYSHTCVMNALRHAGSASRTSDMRGRVFLTYMETCSCSM
eukprot:6634872-Pyramimonas_sp.AAC.1